MSLSLVWVRALRSPFLISLSFLLLIGVAAYCSDGVLHPDEQQQIIEFFFYQKGIVQPHYLPWEFHEKIRPWMQPMLYWVLSLPFVCYISTPLGWTRFLRILTGIWGGGSVLFLYWQYRKSWSGNSKKKGLRNIDIA